MSSSAASPGATTATKDLDELILAGRSTLDQKKRAEIYSKAQKLLSDDAAYVFKWGLHGVWGISNRVNYEAPRDEIDRMWLVTPRKKVSAALGLVLRRRRRAIDVG